MDYELLGYRAGPVRLDVLLARRAGRRAVAWSPTATTPTAGARPLSRSCKGRIPRQMFEVAIQAAIGTRVIARETIKAMRKT